MLKLGPSSKVMRMGGNEISGSSFQITQKNLNRHGPLRARILKNSLSTDMLEQREDLKLIYFSEYGRLYRMTHSKDTGLSRRFA